MNPLLTALVAVGLLSQAEAQRLSAQLDPVQARAYAEQALTTAFTGGLQGQYERVLQFVATTPDATAKQWGAFWAQENPALWASVGPTIVQLASDGAIVTALTGGMATEWQHVNQRVVDWTRDYYATSNEYGSIPNLNQTSRAAVADAVTAWTRGELAHNLGLPSLALELQPTFGAARAEVIAVTEWTRIANQTVLAEGEADPDIEFYRWLTAADEIAAGCPICGPAHGLIIPKSNKDGFTTPSRGLIGFPPAHPRCRCQTILETRMTKDVPLRDVFKAAGPDAAASATPKAKPAPVAPVKPAWQPSMSRADADRWAADSAIKADTYHVTMHVANARNIKEKGFDLSRTKFGRMWGNGVYVGTDTGTADMYQKWAGPGGSLMTVKIDVRNPAVYQATNTSFSSAEILMELTGKKWWDASELLNHYDGFDEVLKSLGFDALEIRNGGEQAGGNQIIIFDPKRVVVIND